MRIVKTSRHLIMAILGAFAVTACAAISGEEPEPIACATSGILKDAEHLKVYTPGSAGTIADLMLEADIIRTGVRCVEKSEDGQLTAYLEFLIDASLGPSATGPEQPVTYFVALVQNDRVLKKSIGRSVLDFDDQNRIQAVQSVDDFVFTPAPDFSPETYQVLVGFQLTESQMEANRARNQR